MEYGVITMSNTKATIFQHRIGELLISQISSRLLLNLIFLLTWGWGVFWIINSGQSDSSVFIASLPAMLVLVGAWLVFLNRGFNRQWTAHSPLHLSYPNTFAPMAFCSSWQGPSFTVWISLVSNTPSYGGWVWPFLVPCYCQWFYGLAMQLMGNYGSIWSNQV